VRRVATLLAMTVATVASSMLGSACIPCDICDGADLARGADAGAGSESGTDGRAPLDGGFCSTTADAIACRDFDDGQLALRTRSTTVDPPATLRVEPRPDAPSAPNAVFAAGNGTSLEAFGEMTIPRAPTYVAFAMKARAMGTNGEFGRVAYGQEHFGLRRQPSGSNWQVIVKKDTGSRDVHGTFSGKLDAWILVEYRIANRTTLSVRVDGVEVAANVPIVPLPDDGIVLEIGFAETAGQWEVDFDNAVAR
jgi:hypothetical protein